MLWYTHCIHERYSTMSEEDGKQKRERNRDEKGEKVDFLQKKYVGIRGLDGSWTPSGFTLDVEATHIDSTHISYLCPLCGKHHRHGPDGETHNRVEHRPTHCSKQKLHNVIVYITDRAHRPTEEPSGAGCGKVLSPSASS